MKNKLVKLLDKTRYISRENMVHLLSRASRSVIMREPATDYDFLYEDFAKNIPLLFKFFLALTVFYE